jgi:hypothetical protein
MNLLNIIERATDFGTFRSRENFFSFSLKVFFYILPAIVFGHLTDISIENLEKKKTLGYTTLSYILLQTFIILCTLYIFILFLKDYTSEFQTSSAGSYFIVVYFGIQTNYLKMLKEYMNSFLVKV